MHPIPAVKASVQHVIFSGICQYLSESFISVTATIIIKIMADYKNGDDLPSEIVAITAGELLAKILPRRSRRSWTSCCVRCCRF